jgi:hypothetical protein
MAFTIRFEGLICHVGMEADPGHKLHAVLISDVGTHVPLLKVNGAEKPQLKPGDTIKFSTGPGSARTTQLFKDRVQGLKELLPAGTIHATVLGATHDGGANGALAYVIFPNGQLDAPEFANEPLQFALDGVFLKKRCVARGVTFTSDVDATELTIENAGGVTHIPLVPGSDIVITNVSDTGTGHFQLYRNITDAPDMATAEADFSLKCNKNQLNAAAGSRFVIKEQVFAVAAKTRAAYEPTKASSEDTKENKLPTVSATPPNVPHAECSNSNWP